MYQRQKKSFNYDRIRIWCDLKQVFLFVSVGKCLELITPITQVSQGISALTCWVLVHFFFIFGAIVVYGSQLVILRSGYLFTSYIPFKMLLQRFCLGRYGTNAGNLVLDLFYLKLMRTCSNNFVSSISPKQSYSSIKIWCLKPLPFRFVEEDAGQVWEDGRRSKSIDRTMLLLFVTLYILFNCIYWPLCLCHEYIFDHISVE